MKPYIRFALLCVFMSASAPALAVVTCTVSNAALNFGTYNDSSASATQVSTTFTVSCCRNGTGGNTAVTVSANVGLNSATANPRAMKNGANADLMSYSLSTASFGGAVWGDGVNGGSVFTQNLTVSTRCVNGNDTLTPTIFGQIPALQSVSAGSYTDSVTMTVNP